MIITLAGWIVINAAADIKQATAATRANLKRILQIINRLTLIIGSKEVFYDALQHGFVRTEHLQFAVKGLYFLL